MKRKNKRNREFLSGFLVGICVILTIFAIVMDVAILKYGDTVESIYVLAKNAVAGNVKAEDGGQAVFSSSEVAAKLDMLHAYTEQYYLRDADIEAEKEAVYKALISSLEDPYSVYYTKEEYQKMNEKLEGSYVGIGVTALYHKDTGKISVEEVTKGGGADDAGLKEGDIFFSIQGESVEGLSLSELAAKLKGKEGSSIEVSVMREGEKEPKKFIVACREVELQTVEYKMLEDNTGYIAVSSFSQTTPKQFDEAIKELSSLGMEAMVIDLRDNGGGSLGACVEMLDRLLPEGLLVYTKTKDGKEKKYMSTDKEVFDKPLAVLMNENSASASEIFAGAIQDRKAGILVGTKSFGKGIVQKIYPLDDGSAVKLTNSEYFTPNGNNIHGIGITPDLEVEQEEGQEDLPLKTAVHALRNR